MARERMRMKKTREVLRMHFDCGLANQQIANAVRVSRGSVFNHIARFKTSGLRACMAAAPPLEMSDSQLVAKLYPEKQKAVPEGNNRGQGYTLDRLKPDGIPRISFFLFNFDSNTTA